MNFNINPIEIQTKRKRLQKQDFKTLRGLLVMIMMANDIRGWMGPKVS